MSTQNLTRRQILQLFGVSPLAIPVGSPRNDESISAPDRGTPVQESAYGPFQDGPRSPLFRPIPMNGNASFDQSGDWGVSPQMSNSAARAPMGEITAWGIPFSVGSRVCLLQDAPVSVDFEPVARRFWVFLHATDIVPLEPDASGLYPAPRRGRGRLREHVADYVALFQDGSEVRSAIRRRHEVGMVRGGEDCVEAVSHSKPFPVRPHHEQQSPSWGRSQTRVARGRMGPWVNWLWAWENPDPENAIVGFRVEPVSGSLVLSAISAGNVTSNPLRWMSRRKAIFQLPEDTRFDPTLDDRGLLRDIQATENGFFLMTDAQGDILRLQPAEDRPVVTTDLDGLFHDEDDRARVLFETYRAWDSGERPREVPMQVDHEGETWWFLFRPLRDPFSDRDVAFVAPERDLAAQKTPASSAGRAKVRLSIS